jgi:hypothetical protein
MKTLVIHPADRSTDFLKKIYEGKDWTVIFDNTICRSREQITKLIKDHDRIIMMGHGHPGGLFFTCIDSSMVYLLREKECVCIWCNADKFVEKYGLKGFYTGMFISEVGEASYYGIKATRDEIDYSNNLFASKLNECIDSENVWGSIIESYRSNDLVIQFNNARLYYRDEESVLNDHDLKDEGIF